MTTTKSVVVHTINTIYITLRSWKQM